MFKLSGSRELGAFIFCVTFLGSMVLLIAWIPAQLYTADNGRIVEHPEMFESIDVWSFSETFSYQMNETGGYSVGEWYYFEDDAMNIGNRDFRFNYKCANETPLELYIRHKWVWFIFPQFETMEWMNNKGVSRGDYLSVEEMENDSPDNVTVQYRCISPKKGFQYFASFSYNSTLHGNFTHAWNYHGLYFFWAVNFDQVGTSYNAFQLIGMLLFFQLPDINVYVNALLAIPIWSCVACLVTLFILKVIPFIGGG